MEKLFEYVVLRHTKDKPSQVLVGITAQLATDEAEARAIAARAIPDEEAKNLKGVVILVRDFQ